MLELLVPPVIDWKIVILGLALINFFICFFIESFVIEHVIEDILKRKLYKPEKSKKRYLKLEYELKNSENWPKFKKQLSILSILRKEDKDKQNVASITRNAHGRYSNGDQTVNNFSNSSKLPNNGWTNRENTYENFGFTND